MSFSTREKANAYYRSYRKTARYRQKTQTLEWKLKRQKARERFNAIHRDEINAKKRAYYAANKDSEKKRYARLCQKERLLMATDADYAEMIRNGNRIRHRRHRDKTRKVPYKARLSARIPFYIPSFVNPLDKCSPFLRNNLQQDVLRSFDDFARMQNIERSDFSKRNKR